MFGIHDRPAREDRSQIRIQGFNDSRGLSERGGLRSSVGIYTYPVFSTAHLIRFGLAAFPVPSGTFYADSPGLHVGGGQSRPHLARRGTPERCAAQPRDLEQVQRALGPRARVEHEFLRRTSRISTARHRAPCVRTPTHTCEPFVQLPNRNGAGASDGRKDAFYLDADRLFVDPLPRRVCSREGNIFTRSSCAPPCRGEFL